MKFKAKIILTLVVVSLFLLTSIQVTADNSKLPPQCNKAFVNQLKAAVTSAHNAGYFDHSCADMRLMSDIFIAKIVAQNPNMSTEDIGFFRDMSEMLNSCCQVGMIDYLTGGHSLFELLLEIDIATRMNHETHKKREKRENRKESL